MSGIGNAAVISEVDIRTFLRDTDPDANLLLDDFEFGPEEIRSATNLAVDKWNETPPPVGLARVDTFPYRYHLLLATCANLLRMAAYRYMRNDLQYQVGGGAVMDQAKGQPYFIAADRLMAEFDKWMRLKKSEIQASIGWAAV